MDNLIMLTPKANGYIWIRPECVRLVRTEVNSRPESHFIQLNDGLEYELFGSPVNTLKALGVEYGQ